MVATLATKVKGTVMTSSPGPTPAARSARCKALVPEFSAIHSLVPQYAANSFSNCATSGPSTNWQLSSTRALPTIEFAGPPELLIESSQDSSGWELCHRFDDAGQTPAGSRRDCLGLGLPRRLRWEGIESGGCGRAAQSGSF